MKVTEGAKKILAVMLQTVISVGNLESSFFINTNQLASDLDMESENFCVVCCHYLNQLGYIKIVRKDDNGSRLVELKAAGIDFLETT